MKSKFKFLWWHFWKYNVNIFLLNRSHINTNKPVANPMTFMCLWYLWILYVLWQWWKQWKINSFRLLCETYHWQTKIWNRSVGKRKLTGCICQIIIFLPMRFVFIGKLYLLFCLRLYVTFYCVWKNKTRILLLIDIEVKI